MRAIAVMGVVAYHLGIEAIGGGLLGVGVFFTLSGYLITNLLLSEWQSRKRLDLRNFFVRRARRLLPGLSVVLLATPLLAWAVDPDSVQKVSIDAAFGALYISNWAAIVQGESYFDRFGPPGPLDHLWSLAVEEQFYLLWPLLLLVLLQGFRGRIRQVALATGVLASGSAILCAVLYTPGFDQTRAYEGTDTRAFGLLAGAILAMFVPLSGARPDWLMRATQRTAVRLSVDGAGFGALIGILWLFYQADEHTGFLYRGGLVLLSVLTVVVIAAVVVPGSLIAIALGSRLPRWLGARSYGIYLWHVPVISFTGGDPNGEFDLPLVATELGLTLLLAALSWHYIEEPIRHGVRPWRISPRNRHRKQIPVDPAANKIA